MSIHVATLKEGDCSIAVNFEKGVLPEGTVEKLLTGVKGTGVFA